EEPLPRSRPELRRLASALVPAQRCGDYAQALMDLGATVCTPRQPDCPACPWQKACAAHAIRLPETYPSRLAKPPRPHRLGVVFWVVAPGDLVLLRRRPEQGLLGGMMEIPSTEWRARAWTERQARAAAPVEASWSTLPGSVRHGFTHFELELSVLVARLE